MDFQKIEAAIDAHKVAIFTGDKRKIKRACFRFCATMDSIGHNAKWKLVRNSIKAAKKV